MDSVARRIKELLEETKTSHPTLAEHIGVTRPTVTNWVNKKAIPSLDNFKKIAEFFGVSYDYLYGDTDIQTKESVIIANELQQFSDHCKDKAVKIIEDFLSKSMSEYCAEHNIAINRSEENK